jgi:hypothetical protein
VTQDHAPSPPVAPSARDEGDLAAVLTTAPRVSVHDDDSSPTGTLGRGWFRTAWRPAAGWVWLATLAYAPWAYGCTRPWTIQILNLLLFTAAGLWLAGALITWTRPRIPPVVGIGVTLLLLQGWGMTLNSGFSYDAAFQPHPRPRWSADWPGAVDFAVAWPAIIGLSGVLGILCLATDLGREKVWRRRLWFTLALTGVSIVLLGLLQKITQAPGIFWQDEGHAPTFFGPYRYHANAGAFINLIWPIAAAFLVRSIRGAARPGGKPARQWRLGFFS